MLQHLPDCWITPVIGHLLWEDLDDEVVVATLEKPGTGEYFFNVEADQVLSGLLEGVVECLLVLFSFAFPVGDQAIAVADKD